MTNRPDWLAQVEALETVFRKYLDFSNPHFWGSFAFFWSGVVAIVWILSAMHVHV